MPRNSHYGPRWDASPRERWVSTAPNAASAVADDDAAFVVFRRLFIGGKVKADADVLTLDVGASITVLSNIGCDPVVQRLLALASLHAIRTMRNSKIGHGAFEVSTEDAEAFLDECLNAADVLAQANEDHEHHASERAASAPDSGVLRLQLIPPLSIGELSAVRDTLRQLRFPGLAELTLELVTGHEGGPTEAELAGFASAMDALSSLPGALRTLASNVDDVTVAVGDLSRDEAARHDVVLARLMAIEALLEEKEMQFTQVRNAGFKAVRMGRGGEAAIPLSSIVPADCYTGEELAPNEWDEKSKLGAGASGVVYRAIWHRDTSGSGADGGSTSTTPVPVAVKLLDSRDHAATAQVVQALYNEVAVLKLLDSPHCVRYLGMVADNPRFPKLLGIVTEHMPGGNLREAYMDAQNMGIGPSACLSWHARLHALSRVARGLHNLHTLRAPGVRSAAHGDVKSENVLLEDPDCVGGRVVLADYGFTRTWARTRLTTVTQKRQSRIAGAGAGGRGAEASAAGAGSGGLTNNASSVAAAGYGTVNYWAPEKVDNVAAPATKAGDIWSLGCLICELVYHEPTFAGYDDDTILATLRSDHPAPTLPPSPGDFSVRGPAVGTPEGLREIAEECLAKRPRDRPTAYEVARKLERIERAVAGDEPAAA